MTSPTAPNTSSRPSVRAVRHGAVAVAAQRSDPDRAGAVRGRARQGAGGASGPGGPGRDPHDDQGGPYGRGRLRSDRAALSDERLRRRCALARRTALAGYVQEVWRRAREGRRGTPPARCLLPNIRQVKLASRCLRPSPRSIAVPAPRPRLRPAHASLAGVRNARPGSPRSRTSAEPCCPMPSA